MSTPLSVALQQPKDTQARHAVTSLAEYLSETTSLRYPASYRDALELWEWIVDQELNAQVLSEMLIKSGVLFVGLRIEALIDLSRKGSQKGFLENNQRRRSIILRLYYSWHTWPWQLIDPPSPTQRFNRGILDALLRLNQAYCPVGRARFLLRSALDSPVGRGGRAISLDLTTADCREALVLWRKFFLTFHGRTVYRMHMLTAGRARIFARCRTADRLGANSQTFIADLEKCHAEGARRPSASRRYSQPYGRG